MSKPLKYLKLIRLTCGAVGLFALCLATSGCAVPQFPKHLFAANDDDDVPVVPDRMTVMWTNTVMNQPGMPGVRGFGGRIMFYAKQLDEAVKVDGELTVYAFTTDRNGSQRTRPDRKFVFTAEQVPAHYSESSLGSSYSFWLPWDDAGGSTQRISLIAKFAPAGGGAIVSDSSLQLLPGVDDPAAPEVRVHRQSRTADGRTGVAPASHEVSAGPEDSSSEVNTEGVPQAVDDTTVTITVPGAFADRHFFSAPIQPAGDDEVSPETGESEADPRTSNVETPSETSVAARLEERRAQRFRRESQASGRAVRYEPSPLPVPAEPAERPLGEPPRSQPRRAVRPRPLPATPRSEAAFPATAPLEDARPGSADVQCSSARQN